MLRRFAAEAPCRALLHCNSEGRPITIDRADQRVMVRIGDTVLAEGTNALVLCEANYPPVLYIPREEVAMDELISTSTSTHCPYKGDASYFGARASGRPDIAWSYEDPFDAMARIAGHIAFYADRVDAIETAPID